jgi:hypothetical protein
MAHNKFCPSAGVSSVETNRRMGTAHQIKSGFWWAMPTSKAESRKAGPTGLLRPNSHQALKSRL